MVPAKLAEIVLLPSPGGVEDVIMIVFNCLSILENCILVLRVLKASVIGDFGSVNEINFFCPHL